MKITDESNDPRFGNAETIIRIDPHDGACHGQHDIVVSAWARPAGDGTGPPHVTLSWGLAVVLLIEGSAEFEEALNVALGIARQIRADGRYIPALTTG